MSAQLAAQIYSFYSKVKPANLRATSAGTHPHRLDVQVAPQRLTDAHPADPTIIAEAYVDKQDLLNEKLRGLYGVDLVSLSVPEPADEAMEPAGAVRIMLPVQTQVVAIIHALCSPCRAKESCHCTLAMRAPTTFLLARSSRCCTSRRKRCKPRYWPKMQTG